MAHDRKKYCFPYSNEYEITWAGKYGAKGEKRAPKEKKTAKEVEYRNRYYKHTYIRRLIKLNLADGVFFTLTYKKGTRKPMGEVKREFANFRDRMRRAYRKRGIPFKYIYCIEIGKKGGIHIHIIMNRNGKTETDRLVSQKWQYGHVHGTPLYEDGDYEQLACYMAKFPEEKEGESWQERAGRMEELTEETYDYNTSRNLEKPVAEHKTYTRRTVRKLLEEGPTPTPGYYIDKNSIRTGINPFTGKSYLYYTEHLIKRKRQI